MAGSEAVAEAPATDDQYWSSTPPSSASAGDSYWSSEPPKQAEPAQSAPAPTYDAGPLAGKPVPDMLQGGEVDVNHLPGITNADGSHSSIFSVTIPVDTDGSPWKGKYEKAPRYALVPSIADGKFLTPDGKMPPLADRKDSELTPAELKEKKRQVGALEDATTDYYAKNRHHQLGIFASSEAADRYAGQTHAWVNDGTDKKIFAPSYEADENGLPVRTPAKATPATQTPPDQGTLAKAWDWMNKPVNVGKLRETIAQQKADSDAPPTIADSDHPWTSAIRKGLEGFGADTANSLLTPLSIGLAGLGPIARGAGVAAQLARAGLVATGLGFGANAVRDAVKNGVVPNPKLGEKGYDDPTYLRRALMDAAMATGGATGIAETAHPTTGEFGARGVKVGNDTLGADVGYRPGYRAPGPTGSYDPAEGSQVVPGKVKAGVTIAGRRFGTEDVKPSSPEYWSATPPAKPAGALTDGRPVVQGSDNPEAIRKSAAEQEPTLKATVQGALAKVDGAEVEGSRVKDAESQQNKADREKPVETQKDHLGVRISAETPKAAKEAEAALAKDHTIVGSEPLDNNGLDGKQVFLQTGKPGDANQVSEVQILPAEQVKALETTDPLYEQQKQALAAGDTAKAEKLGEQITELHKAALSDEKEPKYKFGSTQANLPADSDAAKAIGDIQSRVPDADLASDGKDIDKPHVTVRYGLKNGITPELRKFIESQPPFEAKLGATTSFPPSENSDGAAPIIAPVESPELHRLNAEIEKQADFEPSSFPEYKPHVTVAFVKPELAEKYTGITDAKGKSFPITSIAISDRNGEHTEIPLKGGNSESKGGRGESPEPAKGAEQPAAPSAEATAAPAKPNPKVAAMLNRGKTGGYTADHWLKNQPGVSVLSVDTEALDPAKLHRLQDWTREGKLADWKKTGVSVAKMPPVEVVRSASGDYLYDGTHRAEYAMQQGESVPAKVFTIRSRDENGASPVSANGTKPAAAETKPTNEVAKQEAPAKITKGSSVTLPDGTPGTVAWANFGKARVDRADGSRWDGKTSELKAKPVEGVTSGTPDHPQPKPGAIAVDLDKTLAEYDGFKGATVIGKPIASEVARVKRLLADGKDVWLYTARAAHEEAIPALKAWTKEHLGQELPITNIKYPAFSVFIDDRAELPGHMQEEQKSPPGASEQPITLEPGQIGRASLSDLKVDPKRFQYKLNTDASGATNKLKDVQWNVALSGIVTVWRDPEDGQTYIINGHHRYELAKRHGADSIAVRMAPAEVKTAQDARILGALQNIAEGNGTAVDAAKFLRDTSYTPAELSKYGVSLTGPIAEGGAALARLDQKLFDDVVAGRIPERRGVAIGNAAETPAQQEALLKLIRKAEAKGRPVTNATIEELGRMVKGAEEITQTTGSLFGTETRTQNLALEKAEVSAYLRNQIAQEKKLFAGLSSTAKAEKIGEVGENRIDAKENATVASRAEQAQELYDRLSTRSGPVDDILNHAAKRIAEGDNANTVKSEAYRSLRTALSEAVRGGQETPGRGAEEDAARPATGEAGKEPSAASETKPTELEPKKPTARELEDAGQRGMFARRKPAIESFALPGMESDVEQQAASAKELTEVQQKEAVESALRTSAGDVSKAAGEMERNSPLFFGTGAGGNGTLFSRTPIWYLKSEKLIDQKMRGPMTGEQVLRMLENGGIKADELKWTGLGDFLKGKFRVTPEQVKAQLAEGGVQVQEVMKGEPFDPEHFERERTSIHDAADRGEITAKEANRRLDALREQEESAQLAADRGSTKFSTYTLPGGENYRELLLRMPPNTSAEPRAAFISNHWDEPNVLAHIRFNDRYTSADGTSYTPPQRLLHIEEIQSDWHQKGRTQGYEEPGVHGQELKAQRQIITDLYQKLQDTDAEYANARLRMSLHEQDGTLNSPEGKQDFEAMERAKYKAGRARFFHAVAEDKYNDLARRGAGVPDAPFKKDWHEMAFRRAVKYAAENGYDGVSWTPGEKQNERYALSKQISELRVFRRHDGSSFDLSAKLQDGGSSDIASNVRPDKLPDWVGKDMAQKILADGEGQRDHARESNLGGKGTWKTYSGLDLEVGGSGMKGFYDKIIPDYARKFGKQWGAKVGETSIPADKYGTLFDPTKADVIDRAEGVYQVWADGKIYGGNFDTEAEAEAYAKTGGGTKVPVLEITPEMRKSVVGQGVPLFRRDGEGDAGQPTWANDPAYAESAARHVGENLVRGTYTVEAFGPNRPHLRLNHDGFFAFSRVMGLHTGWNAMIYPETSAQVVGAHLDLLASLAPNVDAAQQLARAFREARNGNGHVILAGPSASEQNLVEENRHSWQLRYDLQPEIVAAMADDPVLAPAKKDLATFGYDPESAYTMTAEATAKAAADPDFLTKPERDAILERYNQLLQQHGIEAFGGGPDESRSGDSGSTEDQAAGPASHDRSSQALESRRAREDDSEVIPPDPELTRKASELGSKFYSGFSDPELFKQLFPSIAERIGDWIKDADTPGDEQRAMMRETRGQMDRRVAAVMHKLAEARKEWARRPREDSMAFWNAVESGKVDSLPASDRALANLFKGAFDQMRGELQQLKPEVLQNYIENYFPHLWDRTSAVNATLKGLLTGRKPFAGKASFLKKRTIPTMQDGLDLGFKPKTWNPVESFILKYAEMAQFLMGHQTLQAMKQGGTARYVAVGTKAPEGWMQIDDRMGTVYGDPNIPIREAFDKHVWDAIQDTAQNLLTKTTRKVRIGGTRLGYYSTLDGIVTQTGTSLDTLAHELGHAIDEIYGLKDKLVKDPRFKVELRNLADLRFEDQDTTPYYKKYVRKGEEKMAAIFQAYVYTPDRFQEVAPKTFEHIKDFLNEHEELRPLRNLKRGLAHEVRHDTVNAGGIVIKGYYYAPADAARIFNNFVSRGLAGRSGIYDTLNWMNQNINALQLGISAFHAATTSINAATSDVALGIQQLAEGKVFRAGASLVRGASVAPSILSSVVNGSRLMREYLSPGSYAKFAEEAKALADAGGRIKQNTIELRALDRVANAWRNGAITEGLSKIPAAIIQESIRPVMEYYVPRMKLGAFYAMAHNVLDDAQQHNWTPEKVRAKMQEAWDSVDNRFGQLVYDNLFWHKGMRDAMQLAVRSVGWNFGDVRELGGGVVDTARAAGQAAGGEVPEVTPRMAFALALPLVSALIGGVLTYLWTGKKPDTWKDYFYPRSADGTRHSIPGYMKDVFAMAHAPVQTTLNKLAPIWSLTSEAINNRDFYGTEIRHKDDPFMKQMGEVASWAGKQATPFSFSSGAKLLEERGAEATLGSMLSAARKHPGDVLLGQLGFQQAPAYMQNSPALNAARDYERENDPPGTHTRDQSAHTTAFRAVEKMYRTGRVDHDQVERYRKEGLLPGNSVARAAMQSRYSPLVISSRQLSLEQILHVYDKANEQERDQLRPLMARKANQLNAITDTDRRQQLADALAAALKHRTEGANHATQDRKDARPEG